MASGSRGEEESFEEYRERLKETAKELKMRLRGRVVHNMGTYRKRRIIKKVGR